MSASNTEETSEQRKKTVEEKLRESVRQITEGPVFILDGDEEPIYKKEGDDE